VLLGIQEYCIPLLTSNLKMCHTALGRLVGWNAPLKVRLQVICVLIGSAAFVSVRKQRVATASLFDQRKLGIESKRRRRDSSLSGDIEMTTSMEETIPLTEDAVDIV